MAKMDEAQEKTWGMISHLSGLVGFIGPLIVWLIKKDESPFIDDQGKESLNFQISIFIYSMAAFILMFIVIGFILLPAVLVFDIVMIIIAAMKANEGEKYRYPLCIRLIR